jgi:ABC-type multidrug transport system fused ATPase/permease subunit
LFIFDEATSALDKHNEKEVQAAIDEMKVALNGVTTVVIAHRLSTVRNADMILVVDHGQVIESGKHEDLLQNYPTGKYSSLVANQERIDQQHQTTNEL